MKIPALSEAVASTITRLLLSPDLTNEKMDFNASSFGSWQLPPPESRILLSWISSRYSLSTKPNQTSHSPAYCTDSALAAHQFRHPLPDFFALSSCGLSSASLWPASTRCTESAV